MVFPRNHHAFGKETDRPFKHTHVDVQNEALYICTTQKGRRESDYCRVVCAKNFFHVTQS